jgi:hypothetical protein
MFIHHGPWGKGEYTKRETILTHFDIRKIFNYSSSPVYFKIFDFLSRTTRPILKIFDTTYPWGKGIQVFANERGHSSLREDSKK